MNRASPLIWLLIFLFLLLPTTIGRFLLDIAGGLLIILFLVPIFLTGVGWVGWRLLKSKLNTCPKCGANFMNDNLQCPICGQVTIKKETGSNTSPSIDTSIPASSVTIDIVPEQEKNNS